jgi:hypothetical protein
MNPFKPGDMVRAVGTTKVGRVKWVYGDYISINGETAWHYKTMRSLEFFDEEDLFQEFADHLFAHGKPESVSCELVMSLRSPK